VKLAVDYPEASPEEIQGLFSRIAERYDLLNLLLSFGLDTVWRKKAVKESLRSSDTALLDLGTGSGKLLEVYLEHHAFREAIGVDFCEKLLKRAKRALLSQKNVSLIQGNVLDVDLGNKKFDIVSTSFVLRSLRDELPRFFQKVRGLLKPDGRFVVLELTRPHNPALNFFFLPYLKLYLPLIGRLISGDDSAYQFLSKSVLHFESGIEVVRLMQEAGFSRCRAIPLSGGLVTLFIADR
jgi:demethylmenaquinone methyltransferase/2-methoxy-6-polyprenyl-1,4-benzoquinol methylase